MNNQGKIIKVVGPVVDVEFAADQLPEINYALHVSDEGQEIELESKIDVTLEVAEHLGGNIVRTVAMSSTDGLVRGLTVENTGSPITVPVGDATLGRLFNAVSQSTKPAQLQLKNAGPSIVKHQASQNRALKRKSSKPVSKSSTCSALMLRVVRSVSSVVPV